MVEAFTIELRLPDKQIGPAIVKGAWASWRANTFGTNGLAPGGALPNEVSRMEEALSWPGTILANGHAGRGQDAARMGFLPGVRQAAAPHAAQARMVAINIL